LRRTFVVRTERKEQLTKHIYVIMAHKIDPSICVACGTCQAECPSGAISEGDVYSIDPEICIDCGACADACPTGAIAAE
jgi:ferredoxin